MIDRLIAWWRRQWREPSVPTAVALATYVTHIVEGERDTGLRATHVVVFIRDEAGRRSAELSSTNTTYAGVHNDLLRDVKRWTVLGELPTIHEKPDGRPLGKLTVIKGGRN